jgi:hypothetical protein
MMPNITNPLLSFLISEKEALIAEWNENLFVSEDDPYKAKINKNADEMFGVILAVLSIANKDLDEQIQKIAFIA